MSTGVQTDSQKEIDMLGDIGWVWVGCPEWDIVCALRLSFVQQLIEWVESVVGLLLCIIIFLCCVKDYRK